MLHSFPYGSLRPRAALAAHVAVLAIQAAALLAFAEPWALIHGFPLDDAWIHQAVARTFAQTGTLGYAPGQYGAGATSYLWAALLATNFRFFHVDPVVFTLSFNVVATLASGQLLLAIFLRAGHAGRPTGPGTLRAALAVGLAMAGGNVLWFAYSGMEASLVVLLVLASTFLFAYPGSRPQATAVGAGLVAGALALTRPEAGTHTLLLMAFAPRLGRSRGDVVRLAAPWALAIAFYVGSNWLLAGSPLPATLGGRRWLWLEGSAGLSYARIVWEFAADWLWRLRNYTLGTSATPLLWVSLGLAAYGVLWLVRARATAVLLVVAWAFIHFATYVVLMPAAGHGGRYQPLIPITYLATVALGAMVVLEDLAALVAGERKLPVWAQMVPLVAGVAPWAGLVGVGVRDWRGDHAKSVAHVRATECALGLAIRKLPPGARVASFDIGGSGFFADRPVLDAGGLSDPSSVPLLKEGRIWEYLRDHHIDYVAIPLAYQDRLPDPVNFGYRMHLFDNPAIALEPVRFFESPLHVWLPGAKATQHAAPRQGLFRITYTGRPGPAAGPIVRGVAAPVEDADALLSPRIHAQLDNALAVLAGVNVRVHVAVSPWQPTSPPPSGDDWALRLGPWGVEVSPPAGQKAISRELATAFVADMLDAYLELRDIGGAARAAVFGVAELIRTYVDPAFYPRLPPVEPPGLGPDKDAPLATVSWGIPLTLAVLVFAWGLGAMARRARRIDGLEDVRPDTDVSAPEEVLLASPPRLVLGSAESFTSPTDGT